MNVQSLRDKRRAKIDKGQAILSASIAENRDLTPAERAEVDNLSEQAAELDSQIRGLEAAGRSSKDTLVSIRGDIGRDHSSPRPGCVRAITSQEPQSRSYRSMFGAGPQLESEGFEDLEDWLRAVHAGNDPRLGAAQRRAMSEGVPHEGGHLVPPEFMAQIFDAGIESEVMRPRCTVYPMSSQTLTIPAFGIGSHASDTVYGGLVSYWTEEGGSATAKEPVFRTVKLTAHKLMTYGASSSELMADGISMTETVAGAFARGTAHRLDSEFINGDGAGKPLGLLNAPCKITASKVGGQTATTFKVENVVSMWAQLAPESASRAVWLVHPTVLVELYTMTIAVGTGGSAAFPGGFAGQPVQTLLGRPIVVTEKCQVLGTEGDVILFDPLAYAIGLRGIVEVKQSEHALFSTDQIAFRATVRADGKCLWDEALTLPDGSNTVGPIVTVETRS